MTNEHVQDVQRPQVGIHEMERLLLIEWRRFRVLAEESQEQLDTAPNGSREQEKWEAYVDAYGDAEAVLFSLYQEI